MAWLFGKLWSGITGLFGLVLPLFQSSVAVLTAWPPWLQWTLRLLIIGLVLLGLYWLNHRLDLEPRLRTPIPELRQIWLPLVGLLAYLLVVLGGWLWQLAGPDAEPPTWPDLDDAWRMSQVAAASAGFDLTRVPLFLVLGRARGGEGGLFPPGSGLRPLTEDPQAPLRLYASGDGVFVVAPGASLLAEYAERLREFIPTTETFQDTDQPDEPAASVEPIVSLLLGGADASAARATASSAPASEAIEGPKPEELLARAEAESPARRRDTAGGQLLGDTDTLARCRDRLTYLGRMIARDRRPYCPVNGVLLIWPYESTSDAAETGRAAVLAQADVAAVRDSLQVDCPLAIMLADLEEAPGGRTFINRFPEDKRSLPLGVPFPFVPVLESQEVPPRVADAVVWLSEALVPQVTYAMFRQASNDRDQSLIDNTHLMRLRIDLSRRLPRLGAVLGRVMIQADLGAPRSPLPLAGCYLAATGTDSQERAFGPGVLRRLIEGQNAVRWTDAARREESHYDLATLLGYALGVLLFITSLGLVWWLYRSW